MSGKHGNWRRKLDKPPGFYRSGLPASEIIEAIRGKGWLTLTMIVGLLSSRISPTAAMRTYRLARNHAQRVQGIEAQISLGRLLLVRKRLHILKFRGEIEKTGFGPTALFRAK